MQALSEYLKADKSSLISLNEKLVVNKNYKSYKYYPKTWDELRQIIEDRYEEQGPGTKNNPIDFNDIDVSGINTFHSKNLGIFTGTKFEYIDVSDWDVSNVDNMYEMFYYCEDLISVGDLSKWDVSKVEIMNSMFAYCEDLESIGDISNWNISKVYNMNYMFRRCENLKSVGNLSKWDVSKIKYEYYMFMFNESNIKNIPSWYKR